MDVNDLMDNTGVVCTEEMPLIEVYKMMLADGADHITVLESYAHRKPIGLITDRDICIQLIQRGRNARGLTAANVMNTTVTKIERNASLSDCRSLLENNSSPTFFVVHRGRICGIVRRERIESALENSPGRSMLPVGRYLEFQASMVNRIF